MSLFGKDGPVLVAALGIVGYVLFADVVRTLTSSLPTNTKLAVALVIAIVLIVAFSTGEGE